MMQKFIINSDDIVGNKAVITGQDARHIFRVLRLKSGQAISLTNGQGMDYSGRIQSVGPDRVEAVILEENQSMTESRLHLTICSAMLKDKKMDQVIKELTQVGVSQWVPFFSERAVPLPNGKKQIRQMDRWKNITRESLKQCRRSCLVEIGTPIGFNEVLDLSRGYSHKIAFWENSTRPLGQLSTENHEDSKRPKVILLIGPEGGFSRGEIDLAESAGFLSYSLGPRILRAETAACISAGLVQYLMGDMG